MSPESYGAIGGDGQFFTSLGCRSRHPVVEEKRFSSADMLQ